MIDPGSVMLAYLERVGVTGEEARQLLADWPEPGTGTVAVAGVQARFAQTGSVADPSDPVDTDCVWLRAVAQRAYGLPVPAPQRALMPALLPLHRQHMTAHALQRGFFRQLLGLFLYRPAARVLRRLQLMAGRVERL